MQSKKPQVSKVPSKPNKRGRPKGAKNKKSTVVITSSKKRKTITSPAPKFVLEIDEDIAQTSEINEQEQETNDREVEESDMQSDDYNDLDTNNFLQNLSNTRMQTDESPDQSANSLPAQTGEGLDQSVPARLEVKNLLAQLEEINELDICNWLVEHPSILDLANRMLSAKSSTLNKINNSNTTNITNRTTNNDNVRLWNEELNCLFLRVRDPSKATLYRLIELIYGCEPFTEDAKSFLSDAKKNLGDYRNKFNKAVINLVSEFKELKQKENHVPVTPSQNAVNQFVDESVVAKRVLHRFIEKTNEAELRRNGSFTNLVQFVRECFKVHYKGKDVDKVKVLDDLTKNLVIPSRSGRNLASSLKLE